MIHYSKCPLCDDASVSYAFTAKDHTVSQENFEVWSCSHCKGMFTQNVPEEANIGPYYRSENYISHSDTKEGWMNTLYHNVRNITLNAKKSLVEKETGIAAGTLLDVGCGTGAFLHKMNKSGWQVTGVEPDAGARQTAADLYGLAVQPSSDLYNLPEAHYDAISLWHVLEHVHDIHGQLSQLVRLMKQNGKLFIAVPNYTSTDAQNYKEMWAAYDVPRHLYHFSPHSMNVLLNKHGLIIKKMKPMWFDSFYVSMLSEKNQQGGGNILNALMTGAKSNVNALANHANCSSVIYIATKVS
jgi:2-polyprenyl-3-methyl-5-hydroxy-6-metoxy-1,4-benzoquinol methylase